MGAQFENVTGRYGAPMGRREDGYLGTSPRHSVRLFRVRLDSGGYDDGGAYWGTGEPLWCAIDGDGNRQFMRAPSRFLAAVKLGIPTPALKVRLDGWVHSYCHYAANPHCLEQHGLDRRALLDWAQQSGAALGRSNSSTSVTLPE
jgi:hypothetical protein